MYGCLPVQGVGFSVGFSVGLSLEFDLGLMYVCAACLGCAVQGLCV